LGIFDANEIVLEIQFGEGGNDSKNFVEELYSAYTKYARSENLQIDLLHSSEGHIIAKVIGNGAGRAFRYENGKHCIQRIPETESKGRKQTSIISVGILPIKEETGFEPLRDQDLEIICQTGKQKAGGQNANKVASAVRMKHIPTGLTVFINGRDQNFNKKEARKILTARVNDIRRTQVDSEYAAFRKEQIGNGSRSDKVRTYNVLESRVVDHRLNKKTSNIKAVMKGDFGFLFK
jgi:peptide chain release factor 1